MSILALHGPTAAGKSSFLRAGLIPTLKGLGPKYEIVRTTAGANALLVRSTDDPLAALASGVFDFVRERQQPSDGSQRGRERSLVARLNKIVPRDETEEEFRAKACRQPLHFYKKLGDLADALFGTLILFVDQGEEVIVSASDVKNTIENYFTFLYCFCEIPVDAKICVTLRSEYKAFFDDQLLVRGIDRFRLASYYLPELDKPGILEAITHPTKKRGYGRSESAYERYRFKYEENLPELIADTVIKAKPSGGILPTLQVICDRLYEYGPARSSLSRVWTIKREDFLALGQPEEQILSHVKESVSEAVEKRKLKSADYQDVKLIEQMDAWLSVLSKFAKTEADGRASTRILSSSDLKKLAMDANCSADTIQSVLEHLSDEAEYVLARVKQKGNGFDYALMHDAVALLLDRWKREEFDVLRPREEVIKGNAVLRASRFQAEHLYSSSGEVTVQKPRPMRLETIDDAIWDHLLALYAEYKGFSSRLGLEFIVTKSFARPSPPKARAYKDFLNSRSKRPKLLVIPPVLFPKIRPPKWKVIGICNIFRGYALIGNSDIDLANASLEAIVETICKKGTRVAVFEERCLEFYKLIGEVVDRRLPEARFVPDDSGSDVLYLALSAGKADFIVGSAPTRARSEQAGFMVYSTVDDLLNLAREKGKTKQVEKINRLLMHEVWVVDEGEKRKLKPEVLLRLGSVLFFTVQYILNDPEDFVKFIHFQVQAKAPRNTIPVDLAWVRKAIGACYQFVEFDDYLYEYFLPGSKENLFAGLQGETNDQDVTNDASSIHDQLASLRSKCDEHLLGLRRSLSISGHEDLEKPIAELLTSGKRHYQIYNFYDAERFLRKAVSLVSEMHK